MTDIATARPNRQRRFWFIILGAVVLVGAVAYGVYWLLYARYFESTDDAYVGGNVVTITSKENATVLALHADNTQTVKQGQLLVEMDPGHRHGQSAGRRRPIWRGWCAMCGRNSPSPIPARPQLNQARVALAQAQDDYARRQKAFATQSVSGEELAHARDAVAAARAAVNAAARQPAADQCHHRRHRHRPQSRCAGGGSPVARRRHRLWPHAPHRAAGRRDRPAHGAGRPAGRRRHAADGGGAAVAMSGSTPISRKCSWPACGSASRSTVKADIYGGGVIYHGHIEGLGAGSRQRLRPAAAAECLRQLDQDRAARAGAHRAGSRGTGRPSVAHRPVSVTADADVRDQSGPLVTISVGPGTTRADTGEDSGPVADA